MLVIYAKYKENRMEIDGVSKPLTNHYSLLFVLVIHAKSKENRMENKAVFHQTIFFDSKKIWCIQMFRKVFMY